MAKMRPKSAVGWNVGMNPYVIRMNEPRKAHHLHYESFIAILKCRLAIQSLNTYYKTRSFCLRVKGPSACKTCLQDACYLTKGGVL